MMREFSQKWRVFGASEAEKITGMSAAHQRMKRKHGKLTPLVGTAKARFNAVLLAEMLFSEEMSKLDIPSDNRTVRAVAAQWIAYWAMLVEKAAPGIDDHESVARSLLKLRTDKIAPEFALMPVRTEPNWKNVIWTSDPSDLLKKAGVSVIIDLKLLGEQMADSAGALVEQADA